MDGRSAGLEGLNNKKWN